MPRLTRNTTDAGLAVAMRVIARLHRLDVADCLTVDRQQQVADRQVGQRRPAALAHRIDQHAALVRRKPFLEPIRGGDVAHAELEVGVLVLLHLARQPRRGLERDLQLLRRRAAQQPTAPRVEPILYCRIIVAKRSASDGCEASIASPSTAVMTSPTLSARPRPRCSAPA